MQSCNQLVFKGFRESPDESVPVNLEFSVFLLLKLSVYIFYLYLGTFYFSKNVFISSRFSNLFA